MNSDENIEVCDANFVNNTVSYVGDRASGTGSIKVTRGIFLLLGSIGISVRGNFTFFECQSNLVVSGIAQNAGATVLSVASAAEAVCGKGSQCLTRRHFALLKPGLSLLLLNLFLQILVCSDPS
jgi:hypothetical protein